MRFFRCSGLFSSRALRLSAFVVVGLLLLLNISACGKKGPVRPKIARLVAAPTGVTLQQQGNLFVLAWTLPSETRDGSVEDLTGFRIKRLRYDAEDGCPTCRTPEAEVAELNIKDPSPGQRIGNRIYWRDLDIQPGSGYRYAIVPMTLGNIEAPFSTIHRAVQQPPPAPGKLQVKAGDGQVSLEWSAPVLPAEAELLGYNLYRRQAKRPFPMVPVNATPLQVTSLLDRGLDNGRAYEYRVSALTRIGSLELESMASPGALITPQSGL